ncbi:MAG: O-antigen ligase family protein [Candidatus Omnitrophica bacterium]|jgi:O-antigen ligase|nr:O-antigen ligase family protein [Candidatus Omnitrophota bacterium]
MYETKNSLVFEFFLIALIIITPLFYGSVLFLPSSLLQIVILVLFLVFLLGKVNSSLPKISYPNGNIFFLLFIAVAIFQLLPLPYLLLKLFSHQTAQFYQKYLTDFSHRSFYSLSVCSLSTKQELVKLIAFYSVFIIILNTIEKKRQFERLFLAIIFWAVVLSLYGIIRKYFILEKEISESFSVFGNRNHFAGFMEMVAPLTLGYAFYCKNRAKKFVFGFMATIIYVSVFLSLSRAGSLSLIFSLILMVYFLKRDWVIQEKYWVLVTGIILVVILLSVVGIEPIKYRFASLKEGFLQRLAIFKDSYRLMKDFPSFGIGLGNFQFVFSSYLSFFSEGYYFYPHNDYIQIITETGLIGFLLFILFLFQVFKTILKRLFTRQDPFARSMVMGGICGLFSVLLHSLADFNLHIPAIYFLFWLILGLIYKCVFSSFRK